MVWALLVACAADAPRGPHPEPALWVDWHESVPTRAFLRGHDLTFADCVTSVRVEEGERVIEHTVEAGRVVETASKVPGSRALLDGFVWEADRLVERVYDYDDDLPPDRLQIEYAADLPSRAVDADLNARELYAWDDAGCLVGWGVGVESGVPTSVIRAACDGDRVTHTSGVRAEWGGSWSPGPDAVVYERSGRGGRPESAVSPIQDAYWDWGPFGLVRYEQSCGSSGWRYIETYDYDRATGQLVSGTRQYCSDAEGVDIRYSVEGC